MKMIPAAARCLFRIIEMLMAPIAWLKSIDERDKAIAINALLLYRLIDKAR